MVILGFRVYFSHWALVFPRVARKACWGLGCKLWLLGCRVSFRVTRLGFRIVVAKL